MSLQTQLNSFVVRVGEEIDWIKERIGAMQYLSTSSKDSLVNAINELSGGTGGGGDCCIDDAVVAPDSTYSSEKINELLFPFAITSFSVSPSIVEMGSTVAAVNLAWGTNYTPTAISINNGIGSVTLPASVYAHTGLTLTANTTYTLTATRNSTSKTASASLAFLNRVYWGVHTSQTTDPAIITGWSNQLSGSRSRSVTFDCGGGRFFHLAYPSRLGLATFKINNLSYSDVTLVVVPVTNGGGFTENYNVYYCNVIQFGSAITLVVS